MAIASAELSRTVYHPIQRDSATFVRTSEETGGEYSLLEVVLEPGGGNALHRHGSYSERFTVLEGELGVESGGERLVLRPGESALVPVGGVHRFYSVGASAARFHVELRPGHTGFEQALRIGYGLAADGQVTASGMPKSPLALAALLELGDMSLVGPLAALSPLVSALAALARRRGVLDALIARYCRPA